MSADNPHGALIAADGSVRFRLWAPACDRVELELSGAPEALSMISRGDGWYECVTHRAAPGDLYRFILPDGTRVPDPASHFQPADVHGPSELVDPSRWSWNQPLAVRPWEEAIVYELHIGTFTQEGTFRAAIQKFDHLVSLGVTAIELMPVSDFPGCRNWGYDGVFPYAPDSSYGRPEDLKDLVEAAHARGLMVLLDVVYNHFGPEGNYLPAYAPPFFTDRHKTPWGAAINFDGPGSRAVRDFVVHNALYWIEQFRFDGLRLDAVHAILDDSPEHILQEISDRVHANAGTRHVYLVLENDKNQARWLQRSFSAQWNDDVHHVLHTCATGEDKGYYIDYRDETQKLGRALAEGYAFQGEISTYSGEAKGEPSAHLRPTAFIAFLQNHDQIGNRAFGDRLPALVPLRVNRAVSAVYLLLPQIPMLFMGEEWSAVQPFPFFCDFGPELASAVRDGRRKEFSKFPEFRDPEQRERIPDPQSEETFASAKLCWEDIAEPPHSECLDWYRRILAQRRNRILPLLKLIQHGGQFQVLGPGAVLVRWHAGETGDLVLAANLSGGAVSGFPAASPSLIWQEGSMQDEDGTLLPWTVVWSVDAGRGAT